MFFLLGLLPLIVTMTTSFTKFSIVLTLLRSALGVQQAPSNLVISSIALAATLVVMGPTLAKMADAIHLDERLESNRVPRAAEIVEAVGAPLGEFMLAHSRPAERAFMVGAAKRIDPERDAARDRLLAADSRVSDQRNFERVRSRVSCSTSLFWSSIWWSPTC